MKRIYMDIFKEFFGHTNDRKNIAVIEKKILSDPNAVYYYAENLPDFDNVIIEGLRSRVKDLTNEVTNISKKCRELEIKLFGYSEVKEKLTNIIQTYEDIQDELTSFSDYLLNRKPIKLRGDPNAGIEQRLLTIGKTITDVYSLLLSLLESLIDESTYTHYAPPVLGTETVVLSGTFQEWDGHHVSYVSGYLG